MASKDTAVGKGDAAEKSARNHLNGEGWTTIKAPRTITKIWNKTMHKWIYVPATVDYWHSFDILAVRSNEMLFLQVTDRHDLAEHKTKIEQNFKSVIFNIPQFSVQIWLWRKVPHGSVERYEFDIVSWEYSTSLKKMVWVERQARL